MIFRACDDSDAWSFGKMMWFKAFVNSHSSATILYFHTNCVPRRRELFKATRGLKVFGLKGRFNIRLWWLCFTGAEVRREVRRGFRVPEEDSVERARGRDTPFPFRPINPRSAFNLRVFASYSLPPLRLLRQLPLASTSKGVPRFHGYHRGLYFPRRPIDALYPRPHLQPYAKQLPPFVPLTAHCLRENYEKVKFHRFWDFI